MIPLSGRLLPYDGVNWPGQGQSAIGLPLSFIRTSSPLWPATRSTRLRTQQRQVISTPPAKMAATAEIAGPPTASSLPLLVTRVITQNKDDTAAANNFAFIAHPLDACPNLHHTRDAIASHLTALGKPIDLDTLKPWSIAPGGRPSQVVDVFLGLVREIWPKTSEIPDEGDRTASLPSRLTHVLPPVAGMTRRVRRLRAER